MFNLPSYEWLRERVNQLDNTDLRLPPQKENLSEPISETKEERLTLDKETYFLDIETEAFTDSPLKALMIKTIQLNDQFIQVTPNNKPILKEELKSKELIVFNSPFEQTQLYHGGFDVWANKWVDVSLMARVYDNRLAEEQIESLAEMEKHFLGTVPWVTPQEPTLGKGLRRKKKQACPSIRS